MNYFNYARLLVVCLLISTTTFGQQKMKQNEFGFELYQRLIDGNQNNLFFSPISVNTALYMAYAGAEGETQLAFEKMLNLSNDKESNLTDFRESMAAYNDITSVDLHQINHFWFSENTSVKNEFFASLKQLQSQADALNFMNDPEVARQQINQYVAKASKEKIKDILPKNSIDHRTRYVMTNALYFNGKWQDTFDPENNSSEIFYTSTDTEERVDFMNKKWFYSYAATDDAQILEIPYKGKQISMLLVLPKTDKKLTDLEGKFNALSYKNWLKSLKSKEVEVALPKFKTGASIDLAAYFAEMGLEVALGNKANFSGISDIPTNLSDIFHQSFVEVNEAGTEASAATVITAMARGVSVDVPIFKANRPFLYIIKENTNDQILFMGRMNNPMQNGAQFDKPSLKVTSNMKDKNIIHQVKSGETLHTIAKEYNVRTSDIILFNELESDQILEGQKLVIREQFTAKGVQKTKLDKTTFIPREIPIVYEEPAFGGAPKPILPLHVHHVNQGETLYSISKQYNTSVKHIKVFNDLSSSSVSVGQELIVDKKAFQTFIYKVKKGDALSKLAKEFRTNVELIKALNDLTNDTIFIGQELKIHNQPPGR